MTASRCMSLLLATLIAAAALAVTSHLPKSNTRKACARNTWRNCSLKRSCDRALICFSCVKLRVRNCQAILFSVESASENEGEKEKCSFRPDIFCRYRSGSQTHEQRSKGR